MKKPVDFDAIFDKNLARYMQKNAKKYTEQQWESVIPVLYRKFGDTLIESVGATPKGYYAEMSDGELTQHLRECLNQNVPVSDFLCREMESRDCPNELVDLLSESQGELLSLAVNLAGNNPKAFDAYFDILTSDADTEIKDVVTEHLREGADLAKERAIDLYEKKVEQEYMLEILSRCHERDERVYTILLTAFRTSPDERSLYASYLASYGDERALPVLLEAIDGEDINFIEYRELKFAIESLGGEYTRIRDFSDDPYFLEIMRQSQAFPAQADENKKSDA